MYRSSGIVLAEKPSIGIEPTRLYDGSRFKNHGVHTNITMIQLPSGLWIRSFNGSTSVITVTTTPSLRPTIAITLVCWVNYTGGELAPRLIATYTTAGAGESGYTMYLGGVGASENLVFGIGGLTHTDVLNSATQVLQGVWSFVVSTWDGVTMRNYIKGVVDATTHARDATEPINYTSKQNVNIGDSVGGARALEGNMALVVILNYALSAGRIKNIFEKQRHWFGV